MNRAFHTIVLFMILFLSSGQVSAREYSALVVEPDTGKVLYEKYANELRHPASVTKMMTLYLVFEALERGEVTLNTPFTVSRYAVLRPPSRLGLTAGDTLNVEDAILGLVTRSANDAASVIAENLGGSEPAFAEMMTAKAHALGMSNTTFRNASGLPDPNQVTTAWDMFRLGRALIKDFPRYYPYFSTPRFYYRGQGFDNHNHLMETYPGMDGIKTGFINSSGFNLVASARRNGHRLIGVVFGGPSAVRRDRHMRDLLDDGFSQLNGAAASGVIAEFERQSQSPINRANFDASSELEQPHLTFGNPKKFRSRSVKPLPVQNPAPGVAPIHPKKASRVSKATAVHHASASTSTAAVKGSVEHNQHHKGYFVPDAAKPAKASAKCVTAKTGSKKCPPK